MSLRCTRPSGLFFLACLLACLLLTTLRGYAQAPAWAGTAYDNSTQASGTSVTRGVATDASGNVFVTGYFSGAVAFGSTLLSSRGDQDLFVAKYVPASGTWAWAQRAGGTGIDRGYGIAVSGTNVYVTGSITSNLANASGVTLGEVGGIAGGSPQAGATATLSEDLVLAKYQDNSSSATWQWSQVGGGTSGDVGYDVAVSGSSIYVTGYFTNNTSNSYAVLFGGSSTTPGTVPVSGATPTSSADLVLAKYQDNGPSATLRWVQVGGGTDYDAGFGVAVSGGSVYVTGVVTNTRANSNGVLFGGAGTSPGTVQVNGAGLGQTNQDLVLAKYQDNGADATLTWTQVGGGDALDAGRDVAVSGSSVYVTGYLANNTANVYGVRFGGGGTTPGTVQVNGATAAPSQDLLLAKYQDNGASARLIWTQVGGGSYNNLSASYDAGYSVAVSGSSVYVAGALYNNAANTWQAVFGGGGTTAGTIPQAGASPTSGQDLLLARYTDNGSSASLNWTQVGGGAGDDLAYGLALAGGSLYAGGSVGSSTSYAFGPASPAPLAGTGSDRAVLAGIAAGSGSWQTVAASFNGGLSTTRAVAADAAGNVFVAGTFSGIVAFGATQLFSQNNNDLFVAKYVPATDTWAWAQRGGGADDDQGLGVAVSGSSVYVTGFLTNNAANASGVQFGGGGSAPGPVPVGGASPALGRDLVLAKYTDQGSSASLGWVQVAGGTNDDRGYGVAASGNRVYVTGYCTNNAANTYGVLFGGNGTTPGTVPLAGVSANSTSRDLVLARYTDDGSAATLGWVQVGGGAGMDVGYGVAVNGSSVYVTGFLTNSTANVTGAVSGGTGTTPGTVPQYGASSFGGQDLVLAKYTDNGPSATFGWSQVGGGTGNDQGQGVAVSGSSVYVTGSIFNNTVDGSAVRFGWAGATPGTATQAGASPALSYDLVLARYTDNGPSGTFNWSQVAGGLDQDMGQAVAVRDSRVYVSGYLLNNAANSNGVLAGGSGNTAGAVPVAGTSPAISQDLLLAGYQDNGASAALAWVQVGGGPGSDVGYGVAVSGQRVLVGSSISPLASFGSLTVPGPVSGQLAALVYVLDTSLTPLATWPGAGAGSLLLYPNPSGEAATLSGATPGTTVQVFDALGRVAATAPVQADGTARLAGLAPGLYLVRAGRATGRLAVQ